MVDSIIIRLHEKEILALRTELWDERRRYYALQEQTGPAILRAHHARGDAEQAAAKLREERDAALLALWILMAATRAEAYRAERNLLLYLGKG